MKNEQKTTSKICSFYVNDWHLATMILPHINKSLEEKTKIITLLEKGIENNINELMSKMNLKQETRYSIAKINWTTNHIYKYSQIEKNIQKEIKENKKVEVFIKGSNEYMEAMNKIVTKVINKNQRKLKQKQVNIINCYEVTQFKEINTVLDQHDLVLNTSRN